MALTVSVRWLAVVALGFASLHTVACGGADEGALSGEEQDVTAKAGRFETFVGKDGQHYFHLLAANGQKVLQSEGYTTLASAKKGIASVRTNGVDEAMYDLREAQSGEHYFNLLAANGQVIGTSQMYGTEASAERGIATAVKLVSLSQRLEAAATGGARFEAFKGLDGKRYFHLRAKNGEIMLQSEAYSTTTAATKGIASVRENGKVAANYEVLAAANGQYYFRLGAQNGEIIAVGETYSSKSNAEHAVTDLAALLKSELVADPK